MLLNVTRLKSVLLSKAAPSCYGLARYNSTLSQFNQLPIKYSSTLDHQNYDSIVLVASDFEADIQKVNLANKFDDIKAFKKHHDKFDKELTFAVSNDQRFIYSPTGPLNRDYDDVRRVADAVKAGIDKAIKVGSKRPLLVNAVGHQFKFGQHVSLLAALEALYNPIEVREFKKLDSLLKAEHLGYWHSNAGQAESIIRAVNGIEIGRIIARDIGGSDPERMSPRNVQSYLETVFKSSCIKFQVISDQSEFLKSYPCFAAVNRAADVVPRHQGRIIKMEYDSSEHDGAPISETLFLVGKGLTYDTGGADIKYGGNMASMHRDKCGAAFVAGFFKTLDLLKPSGIKVYGTLCLTRNNVGEECYVADEIIVSRSQKRIRIGNTDAEGRLAICDSLYEAKEKALGEKNPKLFTIATLTGHAMRTYGTNYTAIMSNGPARQDKIDSKLQEAGEQIADPYEISTIRREDYSNHKGPSEYEDVLQAQSKPSAMSSRGHQGPAAFLIMSSSLDKHGKDSSQPLPYTHIDIAGSCGKFPGYPTAAPLPSFAAEYILPKLK